MYTNTGILWNACDPPPSCSMAVYVVSAECVARVMNNLATIYAAATAAAVSVVYPTARFQVQNV